MDFFLSVIIPCFNSGKLFLDYYYSTLNMIDDVEFIIIDDCSSDDSLELLKSNIKKTNFCIISNKKQSGPGFSRNVGIKKANGKYITFLDSDDRFNNCFFDIIKKALLTKPDLVLFNHTIDYGFNKKESSVFFKKINNNINNEEAIVFSRGCPWGKVYKTEVLINSSASFLNQMRNEDTPFTKVAISYCKTIMYINLPLYVYFDNSSSITHINKNIDVNNAINAYNYVKRNINPEFCHCLNAIFAKELLYSTSLTQIKKMEKSEWKAYVNNLSNENPYFYKDFFYKRLPFKYKLFCYLIRKRFYYITKLLLIVLGR